MKFWPRFLSTCRRRHGDVFTLRVASLGTVVYLARPADIKAVFGGDPAVFHAGEANSMLAGLLGSSSVLVIDGDEHRDRRRALVLSVLVGEDSKRAVADLLGPGRTSGAWVSDGAATLPLPALSQLNSRLLRFFVKKYALKRGAMAFGKLLPVGVGAVVGGVGNRLMGKKIVRNAQLAFGNPPIRWPKTLHVLPSVNTE